MPQETRAGLNEKTKSIEEVDLQFNFTHVAARKSLWEGGESSWNVINAVKRLQILILYFLLNTRDDVMLTGGPIAGLEKQNVCDG